MWTENPVFKNDLNWLASCSYIPWDKLSGKTILVTGATGLIGYSLVSSLLFYNQINNAGIKVVAVVRDINKAKIKFNKQLSENCDLIFIRGKVESLPEIIGHIDYIVHGACPTASRYFVEHAVETINSITSGTRNMLELARKKKVLGMVFLSSMEIYGEITERKELSEKDLGYIDIFSSRSSYSEGKRFAENMCCAYSSQYDVPVTSVRLAQTFGPGVRADDERVFAYMTRCALNEEDIRLSTDGSKENMYLYTADAVGAILLLLVNGERGAAYNAGNPDTYCSVKEMGETVISCFGKGNISVIANCDAQENGSQKYPPNSYLYMDISKLKAAGWFPSVNLPQMFERMSKCFVEDECSSCSSVTENAEVYVQTDCTYDMILTKLNSLNKRITKTEIALNKRLDKTDASIKVISSKTDNLWIKFKRKVKSLAKQKNLLGLILKKALKTYRTIKRFIYRVKFSKLDVQRNKVFAITFDKRYNCNPKYIVEEILRQQLPLDIVWVIPESGKIKRSDYPAELRLIKYGSKEMYKEMSTSGVWIDNALNCVWDNGMRKRSGQVYINTWHGSMGIKKLGGDKHWLSRARLCNKATDYCISNSQFEEDVYRETFWKDVPYLRYGHARNDILFSVEREELREKICSRFKITSDKKIALYAPTFRDDGRLDWCDLDFEEVRKVFSEKFGGEWVIFVRKHFKNRAKKVADFEFNDYIKDVTSYIDIQELLAVTDIGITDYSSWAFDFVLTRRPLFIYAADIDIYDQSRGFYYPLDKTPFPIARTYGELEQNILGFNNDEYLENVDEFLKGKGCAEEGHASERVVELIKKVTGVEEISE